MKHTVGPWETDTCYVRRAGHVTDIARVYQPSGMSREENAANAHLIAAAPDLLAACEAIDEYQKLYKEMTTNDAPGNERWANRLLAVVERARAAIQKATGETP